MTVNVKYNLNRTLFHNFFQLVFNKYYLSNVFVELLIPTAVQIEASQIAAVISQKHSINIHHRKNVKLKFLQQKFYLLAETQQLLDHCLDNERRRCFTSMLPAHYGNGSLWISLVSVAG